ASFEASRSDAACGCARRDRTTLAPQGLGEQSPRGVQLVEGDVTLGVELGYAADEHGFRKGAEAARHLRTREAQLVCDEVEVIGAVVADWVFRAFGRSSRSGLRTMR